MKVKNEKLIVVSSIDDKYYNMLNDNDKKQLDKFINNKYKTSKNTKLLRYTLNLVKIRQKLYSIDVVYQVLNLKNNKKSVYIKRFYTKNDKN